MIPESSQYFKLQQHPENKGAHRSTPEQQVTNRQYKNRIKRTPLIKNALRSNSISHPLQDVIFNYFAIHQLHIFAISYLTKQTSII